jgi:hypothetical protein
MADAKVVKVLKGGAMSWRKWRANNPGKRIDLTAADLSGAQLRRADLAGIRMMGANLSGADLMGTNLSRADLSGANLSRADLSGANLNSAEVTGANVSCAILHRADLEAANVEKANLSASELNGAHLRAVNLAEADLSGAGLHAAQLWGCSLRMADLSGAILGNGLMAFTNLRGTIGLDTCEHSGPTAIDYETLALSGQLPEVFLRGCGLPDFYIAEWQVRWTNPIEFYSCFISYSHADKSFARLLHDALQGRGIRCWLDEHELLPGDHVHRAVDEGIRLWDKVLLCCSEASLNPKSWWVDNELQKALMKEERLSKERGETVLAIVPLDLDGYIFSEEWRRDWKYQHVNSRLAANFTGWEKDKAEFDGQIDRVVKALRADGGGRPAPPLAKL